MSGATTISTARPCPACASTSPRPIGEKNGHLLLRCGRCSSLYTRELAAQSYDSFYCERELAIPPSVAGRLDEIVAGFASCRQNGRLLDVGFGAGAFLQAARRAGWRAHGVEVALPAVERARGHGFEVFHGSLQEAAHASASFDVVVASEILEHVGQVGPLVAEIARVLRPGGLLWATTPHARGVSGRLLGTGWSLVAPPEHLQLFSLAGMRCLLHAGGFDRVTIAAESANPRELLARLRGRPTRPHERVDSGHRLNAALMRRPGGRLLKRVVNGILAATRLGDTLKVAARTTVAR